MEDILVDIVANTRRELAGRKAGRPIAEVKARASDAPKPLDFAAALLAKGLARRSLGEGATVAIIAEVKKASPSKGVLRKDFDAVAIARAFADAGAAAISVLTDEKFFQGRLEYLSDIRRVVSLPLLRKDFIVDAYQVWESRAAGADAVLLISEVLEPAQMEALLDLTHSLGMQALVESHDREHLERAVATDARLIGINNRNLRSFRVDLMNTERLAHLVPADRVLVSESGIASADDVARLARAGVKAVLVGEALLASDDIARKMRELMPSGG